jgi:hypothetical protein
MLIIGERHLATVLAEYLRHHNDHRPHRSLRHQPPIPPPQVVDLNTARVYRRPILGGLINEYSRVCAGNGTNQPACAVLAEGDGDRCHCDNSVVTLPLPSVTK